MTKTNEIKPLKNENKNEKNYRPYIIIAIVVAVAVLIGFYIYRVRDVKHKEELQQSYLLSSGTVNLEIKNLEEVNQILSEAPKEYFVLVSYTNNQSTFDLEKGLKTIIDKYSLTDRFYYLDATNIMQEDDYLARINNAFNTDKITRIPVILYFRDGKLAEDGIVLRIDNNPINAADLQKLLDIYEYESR